MRTLAFVVPVHGRLDLAGICLRQLRRTCDSLLDRDVKATAIIISDAEALERLAVDELGFGSVTRDNTYLGRKYNDGIQLATDPKYNPCPVEFVVPCGSDDWVDYRLFAEPLPGPDTIFGFRYLSFVREDGREIAETFIDYEGGCGIRVIPRELLAPLGYRPADEDRPRGCDTSMLVNLRRHHGSNLKIKDDWTYPPQYIVDWKSSGAQLNPYKDVTTIRRSTIGGNPFRKLAKVYPWAALEEMRDYYAVKEMVA